MQLIKLKNFLILLEDLADHHHVPSYKKMHICTERKEKAIILLMLNVVYKHSWCNLILGKF